MKFELTHRSKRLQGYSKDTCFVFHTIQWQVKANPRRCRNLRVSSKQYQVPVALQAPADHSPNSTSIMSTGIHQAMQLHSQIDSAAYKTELDWPMLPHR